MMYLAWILIFCSTWTWAVLNNPLNPQITDEQGDQMSIHPLENTADWVHSVIFEPMKAICLTQSIFKVTTYIDFAPYLETFQTVHHYLQDFKNDLDDPSYLRYLTYSTRLSKPIPLHNDSPMKEYMASPRCKADPFSCTNQIEIDKIKQEIEYCEKIFDNVRMRFMNAIDHMDYHPSQTEDQSIPEKEIPIKWKKRSVILQETGQYIPSTHILNLADERFFKLFLQALKREQLI